MIYAHIEAYFVAGVIDRPDCQQDGQVAAPGHPERGPPQGSP